MAGFINYDSPDYQRMMQRAMASPRNRTNPAGIRRQVQQKYVGDVMQRRGQLQGVQLQNKAAMDALDYRGKALGLERQGLNNRWGHMRAMMDLGRRQFKDQAADANKQALWGLLPMAYGVYEGNRRREVTEKQTAAQLEQNALLRKHLMKGAA